MDTIKTTTAPVEPGDFSESGREWGRVKDIEHLFGIRRSNCYALIRSRKIRSRLLRLQGNLAGIRLIHVQSVRDFIESQGGQEDDQRVVTSDKHSTSGREAVVLGTASAASPSKLEFAGDLTAPNLNQPMNAPLPFGSVGTVTNNPFGNGK